MVWFIIGFYMALVACCCIVVVIASVLVNCDYDPDRDNR